jgi:hypothetical protein
MTENARQMVLLGPATVAVHDDGEVIGDAHTRLFREIHIRLI